MGGVVVAVVDEEEVVLVVNGFEGRGNRGEGEDDDDDIEEVALETGMVLRVVIVPLPSLALSRNILETCEARARSIAGK